MKIFKFTLKIIIVLIMSGLIFMILAFYGPNKTIRDLYITTAMTTKEHQYLAKLFFDDETIQSVMKKNTVDNNVQSDIDTTKEMIKKEQELELEKEKEEEIDKKIQEQKIKEELKKIQVVDVSGKTWRGHLLIINDPSRIKIETASSLGTIGDKLEKMVEGYAGGINAGGFIDRNWKGNGGVPTQFIIKNSEVIFGKENIKYDLIGFNKDNILVLGRYTLQEARKMNIRDGVGFAPFLIVNGEPRIKSGDGGWGIAPRTAIGQTAEGKVLLLAIDGRQIQSIGATLKDVQNTMLKFGAYNAATLDGGSSTVMYLNGQVINEPTNHNGGRHIPSAFVIEKR